MAKRRKKPALSTVVAFMSDEAQSVLKTETQQSTTLPLDSIRPDPNQPRRLLPPDLADQVTEGTLPPLEAVQAWLQRAEGDTPSAAIRQNVEELKRLARSIAQHGLINPISVRTPLADEVIPVEAAYLIVTGERRYWAHILLLSQAQDIHEGELILSPAQIKATITPPGITIRAHQFIENIIREDINAVERARGMWALRYELSGVNHGSPQKDQPLVPWREVEEVLAISKRYRIFTTSVLNLSPAAQTMVEAHNLAERTVRPIVQKLADDPDLQRQALEQLISWQSKNEADEGPGRAIVAAVDELVAALLLDKSRQETRSVARAVSSAPVIRFRNKVRQTLDFLNRLKQSDREALTTELVQGDFVDVMLDLRNLRNQIDTILTQTEQPQSDDGKDDSNSDRIQD